jgi:SAM-dependent methyltransferase
MFARPHAPAWTLGLLTSPGPNSVPWLPVGLDRFVREYRVVRRAEGWGSADGAYYRALPYRDLTRRFESIWRIRAKSFDTLVAAVVEPLERASPRALDVVDLGAGNAWLAYRLAQRGHHVIAVDVLEDPLDGLGAVRHYARKVLPVIAEFDRLPLPTAGMDLAVFNASLHYSTSYDTTLREALRLLRPCGTLVILDTPMYTDPTSGAKMVREREAHFVRAFGFASNALPSEHYLTPARLDELSNGLGLRFQVYQPRLDWRSTGQRAIDGMRARRVPATFPLIVTKRP